jgi:hypothetical protein
MSATFRGNAGIDKIKTILSESMFISSPREFNEKELQLQVFGKLSPGLIQEKAMALTEAKSK